MWKPSYTDMANDKGPRMLNTIRKKVLSVSSTSETDWNSSSRKLRKKLLTLCLAWYLRRSAAMPAMAFKSEGDHPRSSIWRSYSSLSTRYAVSGFLVIASYSSFCRFSEYSRMFSVWPSIILWQPVTTGLMIPLIVPRTNVGKNMMHTPRQKGLKSG